jgi:hypothetical protein
MIVYKCNIAGRSLAEICRGWEELRKWTPQREPPHAD